MIIQICIFRLENLMARRTQWGDLLPVQLSRPDATESECTLEDEKNQKN